MTVFVETLLMSALPSKADIIEESKKSPFCATTGSQD